MQGPALASLCVYALLLGGMLYLEILRVARRCVRKSVIFTRFSGTAVVLFRDQDIEVGSHPPNSSH